MSAPSPSQYGSVSLLRRVDPNGAAIVERYERRYAQMANWLTAWQTLADYLRPLRSDILTRRAAGEKRTERLFDSTGPWAAQMMAATIHADLINPAQKWFGLQPRDARRREADGVRQWCESTADVAYAAMSNSNWNAQAAEFLDDLTVFCTGALLVEEQPRLIPGMFAGLRFTVVPIGTFCIEEDAEHRVDCLDRVFELNARACLERFGEQAGDRVTKLAADKPETPVEILHSVYPLPSRSRREGAMERMRWGSCYVERESRHKMAEGGYWEFPYAVTRWSQAAREVYGRGPAWLALPDIRSLNRAVELYLAAAGKAIDPPLKQLHRGVLGDVSLEPAALNVVYQMDALETLESKARFDVAEMLTARLDQKIQRIFYVDQFELKESPQMTATEVIERTKRMLRFMGPALGRLHSEFAEPVVGRVVALMQRADALEAPPDALLDGGELDLTFEGPLARAQRSQDAVAIRLAYEGAGLIVQATGDPSVWDNYRHDAAARELADVFGMPANLIADPREVFLKRQQRQKQQAAAATMQLVTGGSEVARNLAPLMKALPEAAAKQTEASQESAA